MKRLAALLLSVCALLLVHSSASAAPRMPKSAMDVFRMVAAGNAYVIPVEWAGIWTDTDSTYDCAGNLQETSTDTDTLCAGVTIIDPSDFPVTFNCSGPGVTATTVDITCTGSEDIFEDCTMTFTYNLRGTRTGEDAFVVLTITTTYDGTGTGCDFIPDQCTQINTHSTRTAPAPPAYCNTPVRSSTWGELKIRYR